MTAEKQLQQNSGVTERLPWKISPIWSRTAMTGRKIRLRITRILRT